MLTSFDTIQGYSYLASYLVNGVDDCFWYDATGTPEEQETAFEEAKAKVDAWIERIRKNFNAESVEFVDVSENTDFSWPDCYSEDDIRGDVAEYTILLRYPKRYRSMKVVTDPSDPGTNADHYFEDDPEHAVLKHASRYCKGSVIHRVRFNGVTETCESRADFTVIIPRYGKLPEADPVYYRIKDPAKHKNWG